MYASGAVPRQRADGGDHAAVVLEVVVGVGDVVLAGVGVLGGHRDPPVGGLHLVAGRAAVQSAAVGVAAPDGVDLGEVGVGAPVAAVDQLEQARAVRARAGAEDAGGGAAFVAVLGQVGLGVGADEVGLGGLVQRRRPAVRRRRAGR